MTGTLPAAWGTLGAFDSLEKLNLAGNQFSGSLPAQWGSNQSGLVFPALQGLDMSNNSLTGVLPQAWGSGLPVPTLHPSPPPPINLRRHPYNVEATSNWQE